MADNKNQIDDWVEVDDWEVVDEPGFQGSRGPSLAPAEEEPGLVPTNLGTSIVEMLGLNKRAAGAKAANLMTSGHLPQIVGGAKALAGGDYVTERDKAIKVMERLERDNPVSSAIGTGAGMVGVGSAGANLVKQAPTLGKRILQAGGLGAAQGAAFNPGDEEGVVDPVQAGDRATNAGLAALLGVGAAGAGELVSKGAQAARDVSFIKDRGESARKLAEWLRGASDDFQTKFIDKQLQTVDDAVKGKSAVVDLEKFRAQAPELVDEIQSRSTPSFRKETVPGTSTRHFTPEPELVPQPPRVEPAEPGGVFPREPIFEEVMVPNPNRIAGGPEMVPVRRMVPGSDKVVVAPRPEQLIPQEPIPVPRPPVSQPVQPITQQVRQGHEVAGEDILSLRRYLDKIGKWRNKGVLMPEHIARSEEAANLASSLRPTLDAFDPAIGKANKAVEEAIPLKEVVDNVASSKDPLRAIVNPTNEPAFSIVDKEAGTKLMDLAGRMRNAQDLQIDPRKFMKPPEWPNQLRKIILRSGAETSRGLEKLPQGTKEATLQEVLERKRKK